MVVGRVGQYIQGNLYHKGNSNLVWDERYWMMSSLCPDPHVCCPVANSHMSEHKRKHCWLAHSDWARLCLRLDLYEDSGNMREIGSHCKHTSIGACGRLVLSFQGADS